jgi:hypothetical protein
MNRHGHHKDEADKATIDTLFSKTYYKSLINLSEETSEWTDFKRGEEDHY